MPEPRLRTEIWIKAQLRLLDRATLPAVIARRGDADAGLVLIKRIGAASCDVLARRLDDAGRRVWTVVRTGPESECDSYIARETDIDPDLWVLDVEDPRGAYHPDGEPPRLPD